MLDDFATACGRSSAAARSSASWPRSCGSTSSSTPTSRSGRACRATRRCAAPAWRSAASRRSRRRAATRAASRPSKSPGGTSAMPSARWRDARLHRRRDPLADARHRRQHGDVPGAERAPAPRAARASPQELVEITLPEADLGRARGNIPRWPAMPYPLLRGAAAAPGGVLDAVRLGRRMVQPRPGRRGAARAGSVGERRLFPGARLTPALGRLFTPADDRPGCGFPGAVVSHDFWQRELGGDTARDRPHPQRAQPPGRHHRRGPGGLHRAAGGAHVRRRAADLLAGRVPAGQHAAARAARRGGSRRSAGSNPAGRRARRRASSSDRRRESSRRRCRRIPAGERRGVSRVDASPRRRRRPAARTCASEYGTPLRLLLGDDRLRAAHRLREPHDADAARGAVRQRELSLRLALGASRGRLLSQLLAESLVIATASAVAGALVAFVLSQGLVQLIATARNPIVLDADAGLARRHVPRAHRVRHLHDPRPGAGGAGVARNPGDALKSGGRRSPATPAACGCGARSWSRRSPCRWSSSSAALLFARSFGNLLGERARLPHRSRAHRRGEPAGARRRRPRRLRP